MSNVDVFHPKQMLQIWKEFGQNEDSRDIIGDVVMPSTRHFGVSGDKAVVAGILLSERH